ncbi:MAG: hypothetical protein Greene041662_214 [Candidatus Peregrinibacteria bacterium Greene0416_62]|nr:MAG: hypothetical protein Greene041662_214 [Candidatus Peregrinibacteria bacterium Greene0416_62]TSC99565.1 MAG: hypothetical protein Greene101449_600 [Candidatus Peregrinibacteria bacterium Greene1014_49]
MLWSNGYSIPAEGSRGKDSRFEGAVFTATITRVGVSIIALFGCREDAIATERGTGDEDIFHGAGSGATVSGCDIAIITLFTTIKDAIAANREGTGGAAAVGDRVRVIGSVVALLTGVNGSITAGGETFTVVAACIGTGAIHDGASIFRAFSVSIDGTRENGITKVRSGTGDLDALSALAFGVGVFGIASEEGIAAIGASARKGNTGRVLAFGVFATVDVITAGVGTGASHSDTGLDFTFHVGLFSASENRITFVDAHSREDDAGAF